MKKIIFICPYFGTLPKEHMELWLQSCSKNSTINWLIFTNDHTKYNYPNNVNVVYLTLDNLKEQIQKKFDFNIFLDNAYKLCDYKPTYGYIFSEYIKKYDFWGYCDMSDCIFGDIRKFITDDILDNYEKIGFLGHFTLYKNSIDVNKRFMLGTKSNISYREILSSSKNMAFDELNSYSINTIYNENNYNFFRIDDFYYDVSPLSFAFRRVIFDDNYKYKCLKRIPTIFEWKNGHLYELSVVNNKLLKTELLYIHFQKRSMKKSFDGLENNYFIIPNTFTTQIDDNNIFIIKKVSRFKPYSKFFELKYKSFKYRLNKIVNK